MSTHFTNRTYAYALDKTANEQKLNSQEIRFKFGYILSFIFRNKKWSKEEAAKFLGLKQAYKFPFILKGQTIISQREIKDGKWVKRLSENFKEEWKICSKDFKKCVASFPPDPVPSHPPGPRKIKEAAKNKCA